MYLTCKIFSDLFYVSVGDLTVAYSPFAPSAEIRAQWFQLVAQLVLNLIFVSIF